MSKCLSYKTACRASSYVCTYGAILRIRLAEEYQSVRNIQAGGQQLMFLLSVIILSNLDRVLSVPIGDIILGEGHIDQPLDHLIMDKVCCFN